MPSVTAQDLITAAYQILGVYSPVQTPSDADAQLGLDSLNDLLDEWSLGAAFTPFISRERFDLVADQGGPDAPYTIGAGGDFDTQRPPNQNAIVGANLILTSTDPEVRIPLAIYSDQAYDQNAIPDQTSTQPTGIYYNPTYADDLGSLFLWPVVNTADNDLELFLQKWIAQFADLDTEYDLPTGLPRALKYNLAVVLSPQFRPIDPVAERIAVSSLGRFKRSNLSRMRDLATDAPLGSGGGGLYNILTDTSRVS